MISRHQLKFSKFIPIQNTNSHNFQKKNKLMSIFFFFDSDRHQVNFIFVEKKYYNTYDQFNVLKILNYHKDQRLHSDQTVLFCILKLDIR